MQNMELKTPRAVQDAMEKMLLSWSAMSIYASTRHGDVNSDIQRANVA